MYRNKANVDSCRLIMAAVWSFILLLTISSISGVDGRIDCGDHSSFTVMRESLNHKLGEACDNIQDKLGFQERSTLQKVGDYIKETLGWREKTTGEKVADYVKEKASDAGETIKEKASVAGEYIKEKAVDAGEYTKERAADAGEVIKDKAPVVGQYVKEKALDAGEYTKERAAEAAEYAKEKAPVVGQYVKEKAAVAGEYIKEKAEDVKDNIAQKMGYEKKKSMGEKFKEWLSFGAWWGFVLFLAVLVFHYYPNIKQIIYNLDEGRRSRTNSNARPRRAKVE